jgi:predicted RNase H-like HicB family nuclease
MAQTTPCLASVFGDIIIDDFEQEPEGGCRMHKRFNIRLIPEDDGRWTAEVPALPGCATWGSTRDQAIERITEAIELYLEVLIEEGKQVPDDDREDYARVDVAL